MSAPAVSVFGVSHAYGTSSPALDEISFELGRGQLVAMLGPNGSGKSTLLRILAGLQPLRPGSGTVRILGTDLRELSPAERARRVVYAGADLRAEFPLTAFEAVSLGATPAGRRAFGRLTAEDEDRIEWAMHECHCWNLRGRELRTLSGGERQLVQLARTLVQGGRVLLLDESLSKMDLHHQARMGEWFSRLRDSGHTIVLVAHDWNLACQWADHAIVLSRGRLAGAGSVSETVTPDLLRSLYPEAALTVAKDPVTGRPKVFFGRG